MRVVGKNTQLWRQSVQEIQRRSDLIRPCEKSASSFFLISQTM